jgi:hypothetical protein
MLYATLGTFYAINEVITHAIDFGFSLVGFPRGVASDRTRGD